MPLVVLFGYCGALLMLWGGVLLSGWIALAVLLSFVPALAWMHFRHPPRTSGFTQMFIHLKLWLHDRTCGCGARSYIAGTAEGSPR